MKKESGTLAGYLSKKFWDGYGRDQERPRQGDAARKKGALSMGRRDDFGPNMVTDVGRQRQQKVVGQRNNLRTLLGRYDGSGESVQQCDNHGASPGRHNSGGTSPARHNSVEWCVVTLTKARPTHKHSQHSHSFPPYRYMLHGWVFCRALIGSRILHHIRKV